ncbi:hypothetical protein CKO25_14355 [Thiocapsa imhoffii]|uniref:diguanylate cyclase n=1 Tax=Thiocapsa imhoffii TaxID=382777 RepID=A0A9X1B9C6_9GAMM|nr:GGDEF domain-containing protein [Thiocapsa imhoffii]MBK1645814.1 hypothetical protein [Thiocapsa imhoffii]
MRAKGMDVTLRLSEHLRSVDVLARWGGKEFMVLMPHCRLDSVRQAAEKLCTVVSDQFFPILGRVSVSIGVAEYRPDESDEAGIKRADDALHQAKSSGQNRVC